MKMIDTFNKDVKKHFKVIKQVPEWFEVSNETTGNKHFTECIYLRSNSLRAWHNFMTLDIADMDAKSLRDETDEGERRQTWTGARNWHDYLDILDNGDSDVMGQIKTETKKAINDIYKQHEKQIVGYKFDVVGEQFDIGLVLSGVPEVWLEPIEDEVETPKVSIKIDMTFSAGIGNSDVIKNASRLLGIAKVLEDMGVQVKIEVYNMDNEYDADHNKRLLIIENIVKDYDEPINYRKLSSFVTTAQFRRGAFRVMEQVVKKMHWGYGYQVHAKGVIRIDDARAIANFEKGVFNEV